MKLKYFTPEDFKKTKSSVRRPTFTITKNALLVLNKELVAQLKVVEGDTVILGQDEKLQKDWFIGKSEVGFKLKKTTGDALGFSCKEFAELLRGQFPKIPPPIRVPVSPHQTENEGNIIYALLTKAND
ncbi:hypothetical protein GCM10028803_00160 [Larkinella knui]|uniref:Uncharacterized protein n=1 Tax=Larkinella knui TaxID=2025310 RepID=A0A3P1CKJ9_9BACT|nr:hypothetical protein [Larkinella knui]RRB13424.1 hypothetical protein EHT87_14200 [Larkinella knui]